MKTAIKHVVITGGASGLGLGLVSRYLKRGAKVGILDLSISDENQNYLNDLAKKYNGKWTFLRTDVTDASVVKESIHESISKFGSIDLAINSAGILVNKCLEDTTPEDFKRVIDVNLNGSFNVASAVLPTLHKGARLALVSSMAGLFSNYAYSAYGASKFGVVGLATTLRYEYEHKGIYISCICPPEVKTPMVEKELTNGNPVSLAMKKFGGSMDADDACDQIVESLDAGKWMIIPSINGKLLATFSRHFPVPFFALTKQVIKYTEKKFS